MDDIKRRAREIARHVCLGEPSDEVVAAILAFGREVAEGEREASKRRQRQACSRAVKKERERCAVIVKARVDACQEMAEKAKQKGDGEYARHEHALENACRLEADYILRLITESPGAIPLDPERVAAAEVAIRQRGE